MGDPLNQKNLPLAQSGGCSFKEQTPITHSLYTVKISHMSIVVRPTDPTFN